MTDHKHEYLPTTREDGFVLDLRCACGETPIDVLGPKMPLVLIAEEDWPTGSAIQRVIDTITRRLAK